MKPLKARCSQVRGVSWHPDGELLATASDDGTALIYDVAKNAQVAKLKHPNDVNSVSWSPVGGLLVTASDDGKLRIFDSEGQAVRSLTAYPSAIRSVAWHPDGSQLLTTGASENAKVWIDESLVVESDPEPEPGPEPGKPVKTDVKEDWGLAGAITLEEFSVTVARYSPDGSLIVAASESGPIVGIDSESLEEVFRVDSHGLSLYPLSLAWAPEGDRFVVGDSNGVVAVFDSAGELLQRAEVGLSGVRSIAVSHDGAEIAVGLNEGTVIILSEDLEEFGSMDGHSDWVSASLCCTTRLHCLSAEHHQRGHPLSRPDRPFSSLFLLKFLV